jgi:hypothetical protein
MRVTFKYEVRRPDFTLPKQAGGRGGWGGGEDKITYAIEI